MAFESLQRLERAYSFTILKKRRRRKKEGGIHTHIEATTKNSESKIRGDIQRERDK